MRLWRIGFAGFGSVNRALLRLMLGRRDELRARHGLEFRVTLVATRGRGVWADEAGIDPEKALAGGWSGGTTTLEAIPSAPIDLLFEGTPLDPVAGEPATSHVRAALLRGVAVVSANKGPLAFAARELLRLSRRTGAGFRFESAVADCVPIFDLFEVALPLGAVTGFEGVLNATSNLVLDAMLRGAPLEDAVRDAQRQGIAEANPAHDLDGWDQAVKAVIVSNVLLGTDLRPADVERTTVAAVDLAWARAERKAGRVVRLAASARRGEPARVSARSLESGTFLATLEGGSLGILLETELAGRMQAACSDAGVGHTAYGMLTDLVAIHQGRLRVPSPLLD